jgi:hypothetical protein
VRKLRKIDVQPLLDKIGQGCLVGKGGFYLQQGERL